MIMTRCATCGNEYLDCFRLILPTGQTYEFASFECAIAKVAPRCGNCGCNVLGHGIEGNNTIYCCAHCARIAGSGAAVDNLMHDQLG